MATVDELREVIVGELLLTWCMYPPEKEDCNRRLLRKLSMRGI